MDTLSQFLDLLQTKVIIDTQCRLGGSFVIPHTELELNQTFFHLVLSGTCHIHTSGGVSHTLNAGDFILLLGGVAHTIQDSETKIQSLAFIPDTTQIDKDWIVPLKFTPASKGVNSVDLLCGRFICSQVAGILFMQNLPQAMVVNLQSSPGLPALTALAMLLRQEGVHQQPGAYSIMQALANALLGYALRAYTQSGKSQASWLALSADPRLNKSLTAMLNEPGHPWTIDSLAKLCAMSRATYARQFKVSTGQSPGEVLLHIRMLHACRLMRQTSRSLADIANEVGYLSEAAFGKAFKQTLGQTPGQWRKYP